MTVKVLLLEDDSDWLWFYRDALKNESVLIFEARKVADAQAILVAEPTMDVIVVDGELKDSKIFQTCAFVGRLRAEGFTGHMIAASSDRKWREELVAVGCNHDVLGWGKENVIPKLVEVVHSLNAAGEDTRPSGQDEDGRSELGAGLS